MDTSSQRLATALEFFEASLEQHGPDAATERNIALCEAQLD